jgi:CRISPR-associated endonuclease Csy4
MNSYMDIKLLPDAEVPASVLMNAVYTKLHKALCDLKATDIGASFPNTKITLGNVLRLHSAQPRLAFLMQQNWLGGMQGYCDISEVLAVTDNSQHRTVSRVQTNMSQAKLKRLIKRGSITEEEVKQYRAKMFTKGLSDPYIELTSGSNANKHRRYIQFSEVTKSPVAGEFDQFGLSKTATVPWF